ncbi:hypothetical protein L083_3028 [Actinoplanes sp. N902-109]|nr:hypothetical protein L083_3028 [Actinoplanes sp. N902-109]
MEPGHPPAGLHRAMPADHRSGDCSSIASHGRKKNDGIHPSQTVSRPTGAGSNRIDSPL